MGAQAPAAVAVGVLDAPRWQRPGFRVVGATGHMGTGAEVTTDAGRTSKTRSRGIGAVVRRTNDAHARHIPIPACKMAAAERRRQSWSAAATGALVRAVGNHPQLATLMASTTAPTQEAWNEVVEGMGPQGVGRHPNQLRGKWKTLKVAFHEERVHRATHRAPSSHPPALYREMWVLWDRAGRPQFRDRHHTAAMAEAAAQVAAAAAGPQGTPSQPHCQRVEPLPPDCSPSTSSSSRGWTTPVSMVEGEEVALPQSAGHTIASCSLVEKVAPQGLQQLPAEQDCQEVMAATTASSGGWSSPGAAVEEGAAASPAAASDVAPWTPSPTGPVEPGASASPHGGDEGQVEAAPGAETVAAVAGTTLVAAAALADGDPTRAGASAAEAAAAAAARVAVAAAEAASGPGVAVAAAVAAAAAAAVAATAATARGPPPPLPPVVAAPAAAATPAAAGPEHQPSHQCPACQCDTWGPQLLARLDQLQRVVEEALGRQQAIQDQLVYMVGHARVAFRTLSSLRRAVECQAEHSSP